MTDLINHPKHYQTYSLECIDITKDMGFCTGNALKYLYRAGQKDNPVSDLKKAIFYLNYQQEGKGGTLWLDPKVRPNIIKLFRELIALSEQKFLPQLRSLVYQVYQGQVTLPLRAQDLVYKQGDEPEALIHNQGLTTIKNLINDNLLSYLDFIKSLVLSRWLQIPSGFFIAEDELYNLTQEDSGTHLAKMVEILTDCCELLAALEKDKANC